MAQEVSQVALRLAILRLFLLLVVHQTCFPDQGAGDEIFGSLLPRRFDVGRNLRKTSSRFFEIQGVEVSGGDLVVAILAQPGWTRRIQGRRYRRTAGAILKDQVLTS